MWIWGVLTIVGLLWPSHVSGPLHGIPLDAPLDAVVITVVVPLLWTLHHRFLETRRARVLIVALLVWKILSTFTLGQDGWCVRVMPSRPYVKDAAGAPHSWDVRADWRSVDPACSAIMTRPYRELHEFPVWFFNLPPTDDNLPAPADRPPAARTSMTISGFVSTPHAGIADFVASDDVTAAMYVDGVQSNSEKITTGVHAVVIDAAMTGDRWALIPRFDGDELWASAIPTVRRPSRLDLFVRPWSAWLTAFFAGALVLAWTAATARRRQFRDIRGAIVLIGVPWMIYIAVRSAPLAGRFTLYSGGDDFWQFQRYAYRIYMQGYWLEGGSPTFWFQPLYRWTAGLLHILFGDSSIGESIWDGWCVLIGALAGFQLTKTFAGSWYGLAAAALAIAIFQLSAAHTWLGIGLGENSASGFLYLAVLLLVTYRERTAAVVAAGVLATLAFYTRLNHLVMALALTAFALPMATPAGDFVRLPRWIRRVRWSTALLLLAIVGVGVLLFASRTWYYTGVFSVFYGTQRDILATIQPALPWIVIVRRMMSSVMMVLTISDPASFSLVALPILAGIGVAILSLAGVPRLRRLPLPAAVLAVSSVTGALFARGAAYLGRFSVHVIPIACALTVCALAAATGTPRRRVE